MLVFDLAAVAKALAQFELSSKAVGLMLELSLRLCLEGCCFTFGPSESAALPSNMVDASHYQLVFSAVGGCYESSCDTLPQLLRLAGFWRALAVQHPLEAIQHSVVDAYNLFVSFTRLRGLL